MMTAAEVMVAGVNDDYRYGPPDPTSPIDDLVNPLPSWKITGKLWWQPGHIYGAGTISQTRLLAGSVLQEVVREFHYANDEPHPQQDIFHARGICKECDKAHNGWTVLA